MPEERNSHIIQTIRAYGRGLMGFIRKRVKSEADAEDILQDVWYQFSNVVNSEPIEQTGAWLYRVAGNKIIDKHRKKSEQLIDDMAVTTGDDESLEIKDILFAETKTPETEFVRTLFWEELFFALNELPEEQRQVFIWHELEDVSFREMAERTGEPVQTLVSRKRYAVLHLRKRLKQLYEELTDK